MAELTKATIRRYIPGGGDEVKVPFNPTEYQLAQSNQFAEVAIPGLAAPLLQYGRGNARTLSMQLFFDTFEQGTDVREHTQKIVRLLEIQEETHAPPVIEFTWGELQFVGVLEQANQRFTLFLGSGVPVRATVDITIKEFWDDKLQGGRTKRQTADFAKRYVVRRGDTLSGIAGRLYANPASWRPIAEENNMDNPLDLQPGRALAIPAIR